MTSVAIMCRQCCWSRIDYYVILFDDLGQVVCHFMTFICRRLVGCLSTPPLIILIYLGSVFGSMGPLDAVLLILTVRRFCLCGKYVNRPNFRKIPHLDAIYWVRFWKRFVPFFRGIKNTREVGLSRVFFSSNNPPRRTWGQY